MKPNPGKRRILKVKYPDLPLKSIDFWINNSKYGWGV